MLDRFKRIMLATPASLIALLRSVSVSWQQYAQTENARAIAETALRRAVAEVKNGRPALVDAVCQGR